MTGPTRELARSFLRALTGVIRRPTLLGDEFAGLLVAGGEFGERDASAPAAAQMPIGRICAADSPNFVKKMPPALQYANQMAEIKVEIRELDPIAANFMERVAEKRAELGKLHDLASKEARPKPTLDLKPDGTVRTVAKSGNLSTQQANGRGCKSGTGLLLPARSLALKARDTSITS